MEDCLRAWEGRDWKVRWGGDEPASPDEALPTEGGRAPSPPPPPSSSRKRTSWERRCLIRRRLGMRRAAVSSTRSSIPGFPGERGPSPPAARPSRSTADRTRAGSTQRPCLLLR